MDLLEHKKKFDEIVKKYGLDDTEKADELAKFITKKQTIHVDEFATLFAMSKEEAKIFLSFIKKGVEFKEGHIDK